MSKRQPTRRPQFLKLLCYFGCGLSLTLLKLYLDWTPATAVVPETDNPIPSGLKFDIYSLIAPPFTSYCVHTSRDRSRNTAFSPPNPPSLGGTRISKSPRIGGFRGLNNLKMLTEKTCVYTVAFTRGAGGVSNVALNQSTDTTSTIQATTNNPLNLFERGKTLYQAGQFAAARDAWQQAATAYAARGERLNQAMTLSNLALAHQELGQQEEANRAMTESFELLETIPANTQERLRVRAQALNTQGTLQLARGQSEAALHTWQQATQLYTQIADEPGIVRSQINQALALRTLGLYRRASDRLERLEETTLQTQPDNALKAAAYATLGNLLRSVSRPEAAQEALQKSLDIARTLNSPDDISAALLGLGNTARSQGQHEQAVQYYQQAAASAISPNARFEASVNQLDVLLATEQWQQASALLAQLQELVEQLPTTRPAIYAQIHFAQTLAQHQTQLTPAVSSTEIAQLLAQAQQQAKRLKDPATESYALGYLGKLYEREQQWQAAEALTRQALARAENTPEIAYRWQWQLGRLLKSQGKQQEALRTYTAAFETLQLLRRDLVGANPDIKFTFQDRVEPIYRELVDLLLQPQGTTAPSQENLDKARQVMEALQVAELENFFRSACLDATVQVDRVVDRKDPTAAILYPIVLEDRIEVILKLPQDETLVHYRSAELSRAEVEATVQRFRSNLQEPFAYFAQQGGQTLYNWLIEPARPYLEPHTIETLIFVLDGPLRSIPMAALYDGEKYLTQTYATAVVLGLEVRDPAPLRRTSIDVLAASLTDPPPGVGNFAKLLNVDRELDTIKDAGIPAAFIRDRAFTKTALAQRLDRSDFDVVHLATHGQFGNNPDDTFILAADGKIPLAEFSALFRSQGSATNQAIELLVLSACRTATGNNRAVLGIAGTAIQAGARSAIASLWSLDDQSSVPFTEAFYKHLGQPGVSRAEALRRAQQAMLQNPNFQAPLFWAAYVLVGSWL